MNPHTLLYPRSIMANSSRSRSRRRSNRSPHTNQGNSLHCCEDNTVIPKRSVRSEPAHLPSLLPCLALNDLVLVDDNAKKPSRSMSDDAANRLSIMRSGSRTKGKRKSRKKQKLSRWWNSMSSLDKNDDSNDYNENINTRLHSSMSDDLLMKDSKLAFSSSSSPSSLLHLSCGSLMENALRSSLEAKKPMRHSSDEAIVDANNANNSNSNAFRSSLEAKKPRRQPSLTDNSSNGSPNSPSASLRSSLESSSCARASSSARPKTILEMSQELSQEFGDYYDADLTGRNLQVRKAFRMPSLETMGVMLDDLMSDDDDESSQYDDDENGDDGSSNSNCYL